VGGGIAKLGLNRLMLSYLGWLNLLDRNTTMVEVVFRKVLGIKVRSKHQQYFLLQN
jgi:hypothetical protein